VSLQYTVSNGIARLRELIAGRMTRDGVACTADNILILHGGQQGLDLAAKMLIDKGDLVITENPTFLGGLIAFNPYEPRYAAIPIDQDGMDMDALEETLKASGGAKLLYTVPDFHNPTGITMSLDRRRRLIELANRYDLIVLEDTPYREIRYQGASLPTLKSMDTEGRVIYFGSFSKILVPGLRLGWSVASAEITRRLGQLKLAADTQSGTLSQVVVADFLETFDIDAHIEVLRQTYRRKKDVMLATIRKVFPQNIVCTEPSGGLFTWLTFPAGFDTTRFMAEQALPKAKVSYVPGASFFPLAEKPNYARFNYSCQTEDKIVRGMTLLGELLRNF
jgi:DNA-binding transcriptional MocR family regulator